MNVIVLTLWQVSVIVVEGLYEVGAFVTPNIMITLAKPLTFLNKRIDDNV